MTNLSLPAAGFPEQLGDRLGLNPVAEDGVEGDRPRGDALDALVHLLFLQTWVWGGGGGQESAGARGMSDGSEGAIDGSERAMWTHKKERRGGWVLGACLS